MTPYLSIITVCWNSISTIEKTLLSVFCQDYKDYEYIVVDGKSSDGTLDILSEYKKKFDEIGISFKYISEEDSGIYNAMNKGINMCKGEIIGIINSDDSYCESVFKLIHSVSVSHPEYDIYHGLMRYISNGKLVMIRGMPHTFLSKGMIEHPACFVRKRFYDHMGGYDEKYKYVSDYDFMIRANKEKAHFYFVEAIIANFDENGAGNSYASRREMLKLRKHYRLDSRLELFIRYLKISLRECRKK